MAKNRIAPVPELPNLGLGDWIQKNAEYISPALKAAGALANFIPGVGPVAGAVLNTASSAVGAAGTAYDTNIQNTYTANEAARANKNAAFMASMNPTGNLCYGGRVKRSPKKATGGFLTYSGQDHSGPDGGIPVDENGNPTVISKQKAVASVEDGEIMANVDGSPYVFSKELGIAPKVAKLQKKFEKRLQYMDPITLTGVDRALRALVSENDIKRKARESKVNNKKVWGGPFETEEGVFNKLIENPVDLTYKETPLNEEPLVTEDWMKQPLNPTVPTSPPEVSYNTLKEAAPFIAGQVGAGIAGNLTGALMYKRPTPIAAALVDSPEISLAKQRAAAREAGTLATNVNTAKLAGAGLGKNAFMAARAASAADVMSKVNAATSESYLNEANLNAEKQFQANIYNMQAKNAARALDASRLDNWKENRLGFVQGITGAIQGGMKDAQGALSMNNLLNIESARSGYKVIIDPKTKKPVVVPVKGYWS